MSLVWAWERCICKRIKLGQKEPLKHSFCTVDALGAFLYYFTENGLQILTVV